MYEWIIIDGDDVNRYNAKRVKAVHPTPISPVTITRVAATDYEGELSLIITTDRRVRLEECIDIGCIHLVDDSSESIKEEE